MDAPDILTCDGCGAAARREYLDAPISLEELPTISAEDALRAIGLPPLGEKKSDTFEALQKQMLEMMAAKLPPPVTRTERLVTAFIRSRAEFVTEDGARAKSGDEYVDRMMGLVRLIEKELDREQ